jgi:hypothetical protein
MTQPRTASRWGHDAGAPRYTKMSRIAVAACTELRCSPRTAQDWFHTSSQRVAAFVRQCVGDPVALSRLLAPIHAAQRAVALPLTDALLLDLSEANAAEHVARDAYELTRGAVERDTEIRKLHKEAALATAVADALTAVRS